ncbi:MAG: phytoene/squalene synthase family protein [Pseudomonadota bacterium]
MQTNSLPEIKLTRDERAACDAAIRAGSKSFYAASLLLPPKTRKAARALYSFCRTSDDLVDDGNEDGTATAKLAARLDAIYAGRSYPILADRAFAGVVAEHGISRVIPDAMIEGFVWDEQSRDYETEADLLDYCARVASTVGVMMAQIMGCRDRHSLARAADLGLGMQLTNIARDVGEDAERGRLYIPSQWLREEGVEPQDFLQNPELSEGLQRCVERLLALADSFYSRALSGVASLPLNCRPAIRSAALIYQAIGNEIRKNNHNSVDMRASTSTRKKLGLITLASATPFPLIPTNRAAPHPSVAFLVDASALLAEPEVKTIDQRAARMLELMLKAEDTRRRAQERSI